MVSRRLLTSSALLLTTLAIVTALEVVRPPRPADIAPDHFVFTLDRGGVVRFNNGKADVVTPFNFTLEEGERQVPHRIGVWEGTDFPLNLEAVAYILPEYLVNRAYRTSSGDEAYFTVMGSTTSRKLHRPEICYSVDWSVQELPVRAVALDTGEVGLNRMLAHHKLRGEDRVIFYWYLWRDGRRRIEDGAYIMQVAAPVTNGDLDAAAMTAERFIRQLLHRTVDSSPLALALPVGREAGTQANLD